ncbi:MAG: hypothetical protein GEV07_21000 [Streptosporangiales bacterium]|nr:hypothetical protein [Streptosporangiales bacterium]
MVGDGGELAGERPVVPPTVPGPAAAVPAEVQERRRPRDAAGQRPGLGDRTEHAVRVDRHRATGAGDQVLDGAAAVLDQLGARWTHRAPAAQ